MHSLEKTLVKTLMQEWYEATKYVDLIRKEYPHLIEAYEIKYIKIFQMLGYSIFKMPEDKYKALWEGKYRKIKNEYEVLINECAINHMELSSMLRHIKQAINNYTIMLVQLNGLYNLLSITPNADKWYLEIQSKELDRDSLFNIFNQKIRNIDNLIIKLEVSTNMLHTYHQLIIADMVKNNKLAPFISNDEDVVG